MWCPDWPVVAATADGVLPSSGPAAVIAAGTVFACSPAARAEGVRRGLRRREAQARCPQLAVVDHDPIREARTFEPVVSAVADLAPGVEVVRPGMCAVAARGPVSYHGDAEAAAERLVEAVAVACDVECRVGVADGVFAAGFAARAGVVVPPGGTARFLAGWDIGVLERPPLADVMRRLGIRTLGDFAALPAADILARFGADAAHVHRLARGLEVRPLAARAVPREFAVVVDLDPPVARVDTAAFAARALAERMHAGLAAHGLACTRLIIEAGTEHGEELVRTWRHDGLLSATDIANRVRWQLEGWLSGTSVQGHVRTSGGKPGGTPVIGGSASSGERAVGSDDGRPTAGLVRLRLVPDGMVEHGGFQLGLWGDAGDTGDRAGRALARVQGLLGPEAVVTPVVGGGRRPADQVRLVPWGDERTPALPAERPWPGHLPAPAPALVFPEPAPVEVHDAAGEPVSVTGRHLVTAAPARVGPTEVLTWAGPWPADERWWDSAESRRCARMQVCLVDGRALLLILTDGRWRVEAEYD